MSEFNTDGTPVKLKDDAEQDAAEQDAAVKDDTVKLPGGGGRRRRSNGSRKNSWLAHVKATMKVNRSKSFKQVLKLAKKTYKKSKSQSSSSSSSHSQSAGKRRYGKKRGGSSMKQSIDSLLQKQQGGSGMAGKAPFGDNAAPVA